MTTHTIPRLAHADALRVREHLRTPSEVVVKKLVATEPWMRQHKPQTIAEAVDWELQTNFGDSVETATANIERTRGFLGRLTTFLHEKCFLTDDEIQILLPNHKWREDDAALS